MDERLRAGPHVFVDDLASPELDDGDIHHLVRVLRLREGRPLTVSDGRGSWMPARWRGDGLEQDGEVVATAAPAWDVVVAAPPVKGDRTEWMVAKLTEVGADEIVLVETRRSVVRWEGGRADRHLSRLARIARESSMQSRRVRLPRIVGPVPVADLMSETPGRHLAFADIDAPMWGSMPFPVTSGPEVDHGPTSSIRAAGIVVGPEGGWDVGETDGAGALVGLPGGVLRTETAALVAGTLLAAQRSLSAR